MHYYSSVVLMYFIKIVEKNAYGKPSFMMLTSMSNIFEVMSILTSLLRDRRISVLDKDLEDSYWQLIFLFIDKHE